MTPEPTQHALSDEALRSVRDVVERIILRRQREGKIDGYTLPMAEEIARAAWSASPGPGMGEALAAIRDGAEDPSLYRLADAALTSFAAAQENDVTPHPSQHLAERARSAGVALQPVGVDLEEEGYSTDVAKLQRLLASRDEFLVSTGRFSDYVDWASRGHAPAAGAALEGMKPTTSEMWPRTPDEADRFLLRAMLHHFGIGDGSDPEPPEETAEGYDYFENPDKYEVYRKMVRRAARAFLHESHEAPADVPKSREEPLSSSASVEMREAQLRDAVDAAQPLWSGAVREAIEALERFDMIAELTREGAGFSDTDVLELMYEDHLFDRYTVRDFRRARSAAIALRQALPPSDLALGGGGE